MRFKSLTTRVIFILISLLIFAVGTLAVFNLKREQAQLVNSARESTELLLLTIERSIYNSMSIGNTEDVQIILQMVGQNHKLASVRIFHPQGIVLKSSDPREVGKPVEDQTYNLFINDRKEGMFTLAGQGEVLGMLKPIYNEESCHLCHGHRSRIIGVLNVNYSLRDTQKRLISATKLLAFSTIAIIAFLALAISLVMLKFVKKPLGRIVENMSRVEHGDLSVRMQAEGQDEVGKLIASFDSMVDKLDIAKQELEEFHFQQMERADRLASVGEMSAGIAHEIKNPLTAISSAITVIMEDFDSSDPRRQIVEEVLEQLNRLDKTVNDLLYFGKPADPEPMCADINALLKKTLSFSLQHRGGKNIERRLDLDEGLPLVYIDTKQMQQVFLNLILNAVQAMQDGGVLSIKTALVERDGKEWVQISVADTGSGIPPQILGKIFTPFFTTKAQGTGLGLAICHKLVTQHSGSLVVTSEDGKGTVFTIELPASDAYAAAGEQPQES